MKKAIRIQVLLTSIISHFLGIFTLFNFFILRTCWLFVTVAWILLYFLKKSFRNVLRCFLKLQRLFGFVIQLHSVKEVLGEGKCENRYIKNKISCYFCLHNCCFKSHHFCISFQWQCPLQVTETCMHREFTCWKWAAEEAPVLTI